ncbi:choice-of-anchor Q domain-containing protein [Rubripirellula reticaptiva]|uniref:Putative outer membrane protein pmp20 n=1 Tax=Rubripirellula reticaptiva TaxID=2528013 RepID=A0A5C6EF49_9BACT|nr:choice-of-anchor Q domain-containing protein [Rubripirellula reticaptiva]TWU46647.1 putative outer membrane protein pmp20 precursor [Rubripirellula reticaptiva]
MTFLRRRNNQSAQTSGSRSTKAGRKSTKRSAPTARRRSLHCESLEARRLLTSYLVDTVADTIADDGFVSLREAIQAANTNSAVGDVAAGEPGATATDTIRFSSSLGNATILLDGSELVISDSLSISRGDASSITIDGAGLSRVLNVGMGASDVSLRDLTITGGSAEVGGGLLLASSGRVTLDTVNVVGNLATGAAASQGGGGIFSSDTTLTILGGSIVGNVASGASGSGGGVFSASGDVVIRNTKIESNVANRAGGGIELVVGSLLLSDVTLGGLSQNQGNIAGPAGSASPGNGGGLHVTGDGGTTPTLVTVTGGSVLSNMAATEGGGLWNQSGVTMTVTGDAFVAGNRAGGALNTQGGGGIFNNGGLLVLSDVRILNNATTGAAGGGGGVATRGGTVSIDHSLIAGNFSAGESGSGGGILALGTAQVSAVDTEISGNVASRAGGGIELATSPSSRNALTLLGVELSDNNAGVVDDDATAAAPGNGGGLHITGSANALIAESLISENIAANEGGGLWNGSGTLIVENTRVVGNVASGDAADNGGGGVYNEGGIVVVSGSSLADNVANGIAGSGGGVLSVAGRVMLFDTVVSSNIANRAGGGIESAGGARISLDGTSLIDNVAGPTGTAAPGNGGGLHVTGTGDTTVVGGVVSGNVAAREGGGLWNDKGTLTVDGSTITGNIASGPAADDGGGGVFNNGGTIVIANATIASNGAGGTSGSGGGVFNFGGTATITDSMITGNVANRAGGGIESSAGSDTTLNDVVLDGNNAGVSSDGGSAFRPLLAYLFDDLGSSAVASGSASVAGAPALLFTDNSGNPADLRGPSGSGVSGKPGDFAFDNTNSTGITTASHGRNAADFDAIDGLNAFTLSGWFMLPATATESIGRQDALIENGTISTLDAPGGFRLRGGPVANAGTLELRVNRDWSIESSAAYTEIGQYVYFAVSYDGTKSTDNVKFYKGTIAGGVTLVDTLTLDAGVVNQETVPLSIGVTRTSGLTLNPFNGLLDDIRIDGSAVSVSELESRRFAATGLDITIAANPGNGGGLHISGNAVVRINDGSVSGNLAAGDGGGLWNSGSGNLIVDGTLIQGNSATDGGGVYSDGGNTVLTDVNVTGNNAGQSGGGIYSEASPSSFQNLTISDSIVDSNAANASLAGTGGGGIFAAGFSVLTNTNITGNTAIEGTADGGGVLAPGFADFSTDGGMISNNRAARAGGGVENGGFFSSVGTDFDNNFAGVNGGALYQSGFGFTVVADAEVTKNSAANEGGGFWNSDGGFLSVLDSTFDRNDAMFGGAIFGDGDFPDTSVDRSVFSNNTATVNGGAIATEGGSLFLADSSFSGNSAGGNAPGLGGGAIFTASDNEISNNDLINNSASGPMGNGGGILVASGGTGTYFGGLVQGNRAGRAGGGFEVIGQITIDQGFESGSEVPLSIDSNSAGVNGGGLHITATGDATLRRSSVANNTAAGEGGGLWNSATGTLTVDMVMITGNIASGDAADQGGGGIYSDGGTLVLTETVIQDNLADGLSGSGGGILNNAGMLTATNTSITGNIAVRAGGGIETVGAAVTTLTDVNLDENSAGLDLSLAGANIPAPLLAYNFNETGTTALATGMAADANGNPVLNFNANNSTMPADLHSAAGTGVSGLPTDRAFDNSNAGNQFSNVSHGQHAADFDAIDTLDAFTLSGWYMLPSTAQSIGLQDSLFENGSTNAGFRLRGGSRTDAGTLQLTVDGQTRESSQVYTEVGQYVYFAVSYDGSIATDNVKFYKGTVDDGLTLVDTFTINAGAVNAETLPLFIGANRQFLAQNPFNGLLDNIRIDGAALPFDSLEFLRADAVGQATGFRANPGNGGGLHVSGPGLVTITGGTASNNFAANEGGGLWNSVAGTLTVTGVTIQGNVAGGAASDSGGGGIYNDGGSVDVNATSITDNIASGTSGSGGGLLSVAGSVTLTNSTFESNGANRAGGGIEVIAGTVTLIDTDLISNDVNGDASGGTPSPGNGGGLHVSGIADVTIDNGIVSGNVAASEGGGLWNQSGSKLTVRNGTLIQLNTALGAAANKGGGGIFNNGGVVDISDSIILSNFADGASGSGGGILNVSGGVITIADTEISTNVASRAGGGIEDNSVASGTVASGNSITLSRVTLDRNNAGVITAGRGGALFSSPGNGGGLHVTGAGNIAISQSTVSGNNAANEGGGLWNSTGVMTIDRSTISGNSSGDGGGIFNDSATGDVVLTNSTISGNRANGGGATTASGGGLRTEGGNVTMTSVTVGMNTATIGGGLSIAGGAVTIGSTIVSGNMGATDANVNGAFSDAGNNVIGGTARLAPLASNGGPTMTHALLPGSPAINNGNNAGLAVDQRGVARPQGSRADSGAYESSLAGSLDAVVVPVGDVDGNGSVTALDALQVINFLGRNKSSAAGESAGAEVVASTNLDVNGDGRVTAIDALMILNSIGRSKTATDIGEVADLQQDTEMLSPIESVLEQRRRVIDDLLLQQLANDAFTARAAR